MGENKAATQKTRYIIHRRFKATGQHGNSTIGFDYKTGKAQVDDLNKQYPQIDHWLKPIWIETVEQPAA